MHYTGTIWRPPYEARSLLLEVTAGCTHHRCKFCTLYQETPFRMSPLEDVEADLREAARAVQNGFAFSRAFLTGGNPFALASPRLLDIAGLLNRYVPTVQTIGCFARVTDVGRKSDEELASLRRAGFDGLTIGIETGDGEALRFMNKGYQPEDIILQCKRLDLAGIRYSFFYLAGISGAGRGETGAKATAEVCNQLHPTLIGTNMLTIYPESALAQEIRQGNWSEEGELEKYRELRTLVAALDIPTVFAALGASNAYPLQGVLPRDREALLAALDQILGQAGEEDLRHYRDHLPHL